MKSILPGANKIVMDDLAGKQTVPYLPLDQFMPRREPAKSDTPAAGGGH